MVTLRHREETTPDQSAEEREARPFAHQRKSFIVVPLLGFLLSLAARQHLVIVAWEEDEALLICKAVRNLDP